MGYIDVEELKKKAFEKGNKSTKQRAKAKLKVLLRDDFKCVVCGSEEYLTIDHFRKFGNISNRNAVSYSQNHHILRTLCVDCHIRQNKIEKAKKIRWR